MKKVYLFLLISLIMVIGFSGSAHAIIIINNYDEVDWSGSFTLQGSGGFVNPIVMVGFNPQPELPGVFDTELVSLDLANPRMPTISVPTLGIQRFGILISTFIIDDNGIPVPLQINASGVPDINGHIELNVMGLGGESFFDLFYDITFDSIGVFDPASWVGFNPQPEPPGFPLGSASIGFDFRFTSLSATEVNLSMGIVDVNGNTMSFVGVPEPSSILLLGSGLIGLAGVLMKRRR
jgi:hypothetical protein